MHYILLLIFLICTPCTTVAAHAADSSIVFSQTNRSMSVNKAYRLQKAFVRNQASYGNTMAGFKMELNYPRKQQEYGLDQAITGIIMRSAIEENNSTIAYQGSGMKLKMGLAYQAAQTIKKPVASVEQLKKHFHYIKPAIELPLLSFSNKDFNGFDIIANNAMAHKIILLEGKKSLDNVDQIAYQLRCEDTLLYQSTDSSLGDGQWETLLWMVNHLISQGYTVRSGQVLFTGGFQEMSEAKPCDYVADFGELGRLQFTVK